MSPKSYAGGSSVYSDDRFSSTSSQYSVTYTKLPKKQPLSVRFLSWAAGAPSGATAVKRKTRDIRDDRSTRSSGSSRSYWSEPDTQLFWVASPHGYYASGGSSSSSSGRSSRSGRSRKSGSSGPRKHFEGAVPRPQPPPPVPADGHFVPPQPPMDYPPPPPPMGGGFGPRPGGFMPPPPPPMNMPHHPPPPPQGMNPPMPGGAAFIDLTGQGQAGMSFDGAQGGYNSQDDYFTSDDEA